MPEWNGRQSSILDFVHGIYKRTYMNSHILTEVLNIYYLSTNRGISVACIAQTVYTLHLSKDTAICSIHAVADGFNRFTSFFIQD